MNTFLRIILFLLIISVLPGYGQKQLAITIDDPNTYDTPLLNWEERNKKILAVLDEYQVKAALFVCGMRVDDEKGLQLLKDWDNHGHSICNHSYSHSYLNSPSVSAKFFEADFLKNDSLIFSYSNFKKLFRFPFLKEGESIEKRDSVRKVLAASGYTNGHVTIDASDWYIDSKMAEALRKNPSVDVSPYKEYYIQHILNRAQYYDSLATVVLKRKVPHTLLIHHSLLNALFLDDLLTVHA